MEGPKNAPQLYARIEAHEESGEVTHETVEVSEPQAERPRRRSCAAALPHGLCGGFR